MLLTGKNAFATGAGLRIGKKIPLALAKEGHHGAVNDVVSDRAIAGTNEAITVGANFISTD